MGGLKAFCAVVLLFISVANLCSSAVLPTCLQPKNSTSWLLKNEMKGHIISCHVRNETWLISRTVGAVNGCPKAPLASAWPTNQVAVNAITLTVGSKLDSLQKWYSTAKNGDRTEVDGSGFKPEQLGLTVRKKGYKASTNVSFACPTNSGYECTYLNGAKVVLAITEYRGAKDCFVLTAYPNGSPVPMPVANKKP